MKTFLDYGIDIGNGSGTEVPGQCPQCSSTRKKKDAKPLSVNTVKGLWHCNHCGEAGGLEGGWRGSKKEPERPKYSRPRFEERVPLESETALYQWFSARGISREMVEAHRITLGPIYMPQVEESIPCIQFPYFKGGEVVNVKYRGLADKCFRQHGGAEKVMYGLDGLVGLDTGVVVEGEIDALSLDQAGIQGVVSVPDGAPDPKTKQYDKKFDYLENCKAQLDPLTKIVIAVDSDEPGKRLQEELVRRLGPERCWIVEWPDECKDANEVLVSLGVRALADCIAQAKPVPIEGVFEVSDLTEEVVELHQHRQRPGKSTGWRCLDALYTVRPGELTIVTGIPSHGKSEWLDALMVNVAEEQDWAFGIFSPENFPTSNHVAKLIAKRSGKEFVSLSMTELAAELAWADQHFYFAVNGESTLNLDGILAKAHRMVKRYGIRGFLIDPWNEIDHSMGSMREDLYISQSLTKIRRFGRTYGVHMFVVAHPSKILRDRDGEYPVPTLYDISGGANWRNKADNGIVIWRNITDPKLETIVYVQKIKNRQNGKPGVASLLWNPAGGRYYESRRDG